MKEKKWGIIIGYPKWKAWGRYDGKRNDADYDAGAPDLSYVNTWMKGYEYDTREEARKKAKSWTEDSLYWNYKAKKKP